MTRIKVCGLQPEDDLNFVEDERVSHIGVIFVPESKRYVAPDCAAQLVNRVRGRARVMGVFSDASLNRVRSDLRQSGAHGAQLHGDETPDMCHRLRNEGYEVWKALRVFNEETAEELLDRISNYNGVVDGVLLDAAPPKGVPSGVTGGHGNAFNWGILSKLLLLAKNQSLAPVWVAGGLNADNVKKLLEYFMPFGVDVSSGVETNGRKDPQRISAFIEAVKQPV